MLKPQSYKLPNEPIFHQLLKNSKAIPGVIISDPTCDAYANYTKLLLDIVVLRQQLYDALPQSLFDSRGIICPESPYILVAAPGNYEFIVATFTILAIGGAIIPIAPGVLPEEAVHFLRDSQSSVLLASRPCWERGAAIQAHTASTQGPKVTVIPISSATWSPNPSRESSTTASPTVSIDGTLTIDPSRPSLVLYTSGTTGLPKGVVQLRPYFSHGYGTSTADLFLTHRPVHWIGGLRSIINLVVSGTPQEMVEPHEAAIWERLRVGGVTMLCCVIPMWCRLRQYYLDVLVRLPEEGREEYLRGARALRVARVGGAAPMPGLLRFWREKVGLPLEVTYGCTETGGPGMMTDRSCDRKLELSLGKPEPGVQVRLSDGNEGEILIKSSFVFSGYLGAKTTTQTCFTPDGFFKTGDYGRRVGNEYVIEGRVATDFVRFHGYKISIVEVETRLAELPLVTEACIVSIPDSGASTRVAAVVRFAPNYKQVGNLASIRNALSEHLAEYKLPTALRVLAPHEEIPATVVGKVIRRKVVERYFVPPGGGDYDAVAPGVEVWDIGKKSERSVRAWDWAGLQGC
ncbi:hypothetical protein F4777DRAFT_596605 [Nemania sp. FL0916]|nr:hypothetical protein F4777DRAFT_596605 [Nemania sp. FL0916]